MCPRCVAAAVAAASPAQQAFWMEYEMKRRKLSQPKSKKMFKKHADLTHKKNMPKRQPMRGGIRL